MARGRGEFERKRGYLAPLPEVTDDAILRVALADQAHNTRTIVRDYREDGHALWERFLQKTGLAQHLVARSRVGQCLDQVIRGWSRRGAICGDTQRASERRRMIRR